MFNCGIKFVSTATIQWCKVLKSLAFSVVLLSLSSGYAAAADLTALLSPNGSSQFSGYRLYYKTGASGAPYDGIDADQGASPIDIPKSAITDSTNGEFILTGLQDGTVYYFAATIYDQYGNESPFSSEIVMSTPTVPENQAPAAEAGADQAVNAGTTVTLDGSASQDPDGSISAFRWTQIGGEAILLEGGNTATATFNSPDAADMTTLTFQLQVTDQQGLTAVDTCRVTVAPADPEVGGDSDSTPSPDGNPGVAGDGSPMIVDDMDAAFSTQGAWSVSDKAVGFYGGSYAYARAGDGSSAATFTFEIPADGNYEIAAQWPAHDSRAPDAPFTLVNNGVVVDTIRVNQQTDGGQFNLLSGPASAGAGIYVLNAGVLEVVLSNDASGKVAADAIRVVDMRPTDVVVETPDIPDVSTIADNADSTFSTTGTWSVSNKAVGFFGDDYAYAYAGDGSATAAFTFEIPADGKYEIAAQWPAHDSRAPDAPFTLVNNGVVVDTIRVNQQTDGGQFNLLSGPASMGAGIYVLNAGVLEVILSNDASGKVAADAVQVVDLGPVVSITADNSDEVFLTTGAWSVSNKAVGFFGDDYAYAYAGDGTATAAFTFKIPADGDYEIAAQWPAHDSRAPDAPFTLVNNGVVVDTIRVNQQTNGGQFNLLSGPSSMGTGNYALNAGVLEVVLSNDAGGKVAADAIRVQEVLRY
jgi:chitodextrinase